MPILRDYFSKFESIIIFEESHKQFKKYKESFSDMLDGSYMDAQYWVSKIRPQEKIIVEINKIIQTNCQSFKQFILSDRKYGNKDLCKKIYQMNNEDMNRLISKTCLYEEKWSHEDNIAADDDDGIGLNFRIENIDKILREKVEELKEHIITHHDEYFSNNGLTNSNTDLVLNDTIVNLDLVGDDHEHTTDE